MTFSFKLPLSLSTEIRHCIQCSVNRGQELLESFLTEESQFSSRHKQILIKHEFSRQIFDKNFKYQISSQSLFAILRTRLKMYIFLIICYQICLQCRSFQIPAERLPKLLKSPTLLYRRNGELLNGSS